MFKKMLAVLVVVGATFSAQAANEHTMVGSYTTAGGQDMNADWNLGFRYYLKSPGTDVPVWVAPFATKADYVEVTRADISVDGSSDNAMLLSGRYFVTAEIAASLKYLSAETMASDISGFALGVEYYLPIEQTVSVGLQYETATYDNAFADGDITSMIITAEALMDKLWLDLRYVDNEIENFSDGTNTLIGVKYFLNESLYAGINIGSGDGAMTAGSLALTDVDAEQTTIVAGYVIDDMLDVEGRLGTIGDDSDMFYSVTLNARF